ncbi:hypothetical protein B296_00055204 [Ensete ventricosum]|uniref:Uncharacterized protein n=1 Tax=Ensete ventricosum TaxID=4639 RepID=A0A426XB11_ENSVE|nr:hypothetical protein B296_00055204 [Ensete ventricosum]
MWLAAHQKFARSWPRFRRCCRELIECSPEVCQEVRREFADKLSGAHQKFTRRMLGVRQEFTKGDQEFAKGSLEGCQEVTGSSSRDQLTTGQQRLSGVEADGLE